MHTDMMRTAHVYYTLLFIGICLVISQGSVTEKVCEKDKWVYVQSAKKYIVGVQEVTDCISAFKICAMIGGQGLIVRDNATQQAAFNYTKKTLCKLGSKYQFYWIGSMMNQAVQYQWVNGRLVPNIKRQMVKRAPLKLNDSCVLVSCVSGKWAPSSSNHHWPYLCESPHMCPPLPEIVVSDEKGLTSTRNNVALIKSELDVEVRCYLLGFTSLMKNLSLTCGRERQQKQVNFTSVLRLKVNFKLHGELCVCEAVDESPRPYTSNLTLHFDNDIQKSTDLLHYLDNAIHNNEGIGRQKVMTYDILSELDNFTYGLKNVTTVTSAENILKSITRVTECCINHLDSKSRQNLLAYVERVTAKVCLIENSSFEFSSTNFGLLVNRLSIDDSGIWNYSVIHDAISPGSGHISVLLVKNTQKVYPGNIGTITIVLSIRAIIESLSAEDKYKMDRISVAVYTDPKYIGLNLNSTIEKIDSRVVSISVPGVRVKDLNEDVTLTFLHRKSDMLPKCVFWDPYSINMNGEMGNWEEDGCTVLEFGTHFVTCSCNHLTSFAFIMTIGEPSTKHRRVLDILSIAGCVTSAITLAVTILTYCLFPSLLNDTPSQILMHICAALMMVNVLFVVNAFVVYTRYWIYVLCKCVAMSLHYFMLSALMWMSCDAYYLYMGMVKVFINVERNYLFLFSLVSWGVPFLIVVVNASLFSKDSYDLIYDNICWIKTHVAYYSFILPAFLLMIFNYVIFAIVIQYLIRVSSAELLPSGRKAIKRQLKGGMSLACLLGLAWVFGFLSIVSNQTVFSYLFVIFNTFQGFFIFIFFCLLKTNVKYFWTKMFWGDPPPVLATTTTRTDNYESEIISDINTRDRDEREDLSKIFDGRRRLSSTVDPQKFIQPLVSINGGDSSTERTTLTGIMEKEMMPTISKNLKKEVGKEDKYSIGSKTMSVSSKRY